MECHYLQAADSWCFIGRIRAEARRSKESVCGAYEEALECAKRATSVRKQVRFVDSTVPQEKKTERVFSHIRLKF